MKQVDIDFDTLLSDFDLEARVEARLKLHRIQMLLGDTDYLILVIYLQGYVLELQDTLALSANALKRKVKSLQQVLAKHELEEWLENLFSPAEKFHP